MEEVSLTAQSAAGLASLGGRTEPVSSVVGDILADDHLLHCQTWLLSAGQAIKPRQLLGRCRW